MGESETILTFKFGRILTQKEQDTILEAIETEISLFDERCSTTEEFNIKTY
jgi:hypothetical protein